MTGLCVDLCSGLGGFSQAFIDAGWEVIRIDNDPKFKDVPNTMIADVCDLETIKNIIGERKVNVVLASPPCERFSIAMPTWPKKGIGKALSIVGACLEIIVELKPEYWMLENPKGRLRWFLGKPRQSIHLNSLGYRTLKPTDLWGNIPLPLLNDVVKPINFRTHGRSRLFDAVHEPAKRALLPIGLSKAVLEAVSF